MSVSILGSGNIWDDASARVAVVSSTTGDADSSRSDEREECRPRRLPGVKREDGDCRILIVVERCLDENERSDFVAVVEHDEERGGGGDGAAVDFFEEGAASGLKDQEQKQQYESSSPNGEISGKDYSFGWERKQSLKQGWGV